MTLTIKKSTLAANIYVFTTVVFLYLPFFQVGTYNFTLGTAAALLLLATSIPSLARGGWSYAEVLFAAWLFPFAVYTGHIILATAYALPFMDFFRSYSLWCLSSLLIWMAFQKRTKFSDANWEILLLTVVTFAVLQYLDQMYGSGTLTNIVKSLGIYNPLTYGTEAAIADMKFRAVGTYYEPSMLGRVICTLAAVVLVTQRRTWLVLFSLAACIFVSRSLSVVVLGGGSLLLIFGRPTVRSILVVIVAAIGTFLLFGNFIISRLTFESGIYDTSSYIRLIMPMFAVREILPAYPFGVPIGSNKLIVELTLAPLFSHYEPKITNGLYEFVLLFGFPGVAIILIMIGAILRYWLKGRAAASVICFFLLLSTAASSSYLNIESSLLLNLMIVTIRARLKREDIKQP